MLALFLALSVALALLIWAEAEPARRSTRQMRATKTAPDLPVLPLAQARKHPAPVPQAPAAAPPRTEADTRVIERVMEHLGALPAKQVSLPRITGFAPGDVIEIEIEGPLPRSDDIAFRQIGRDAELIIEGVPTLVFENMTARSLSAAALRFRRLRAA